MNEDKTVNEVQSLYKRVALAFAARVDDIFQSEATLKAAHDKYFSALPYDRTQHWDTILRKELAEDWNEFGPEVKSSPTQWDQRMILWHLSQHIDYNLFSQVLLNLQPGVLAPYQTAAMQEHIEALKKKYEGCLRKVDDAKAKMVKNASKVEDLEYNRDLSTLKALKIAANITGSRSFRVSPKGSTPALADSENLSMMGIGGDRYLNVPPGFKAWYVTWEQSPNLLIDAGKGPNGFPQFHALGNIQYPFESKSGGGMLNDVLFSRLVTTRLFQELGLDHAVTFILRLTSVMMLTNAPVDYARHTFDHFGYLAGSINCVQNYFFYLYLAGGRGYPPHLEPYPTPLSSHLSLGPYQLFPSPKDEEFNFAGIPFMREGPVSFSPHR